MEGHSEIREEMESLKKCLLDVVVNKTPRSTRNLARDVLRCCLFVLELICTKLSIAAAKVSTFAGAGLVPVCRGPNGEVRMLLWQPQASFSKFYRRNVQLAFACAVHACTICCANLAGDSSTI
eukprot:4145843-Amphidinium_carterae.2